MKYRFVLYGTWETTRGAIALNNANAALRRAVAGNGGGENTDRYLQAYDAERVAGQVRTQLALLQLPQTDVIVKNTPYGKQYICIETPYECAHRVWPVLVMTAYREGIVALDVQLNRYEFEPLSQMFSWRDLSLRTKELNEQIRRKTESIWQLRRLYKAHFIRHSEAAYVVTLEKSRKYDLYERTMSFYRLLLSLLQPEEELLCMSQSFIVQAKNYSVSYTVEAYRKNPGQICYMDKDNICVEPLRRISCERAFEWLRRNPGEHHSSRNRTTERMAFTEMVYRYPNPADRFCASLNITKALKKEFLEIDYSCYRHIGPDIVIHKVPLNQCRWQDEYDIQTFSALKLGEQTATFILPFIEEQYPFFSRRNSLADNHIPAQMLESIIRRLKDIQTQLYKAEKLEELEPYLKNANFYAVKQKDRFAREDDRPVTEQIREYRLNIARLYGMFIQWAESQLEYGDNNDLYNIIGP